MRTIVKLIVGQQRSRFQCVGALTHDYLDFGMGYLPRSLPRSYAKPWKTAKVRSSEYAKRI